jgi:hypothetical protein
VTEYEDLVACAPTRQTREEKDAWFEERDFNPIAVLRVGYELAETRLSQLQEGDTIGERELTVALQSAVLFGFELAVRVLEARP